MLLALMRYHEVAISSREGSGQPVTFFSWFNYSLQGFSFCRGAVCVPCCEAVCKYALNGCLLDGHQQLPLGVVPPEHSQEIESLLCFLHCCSCVGCPGKVPGYEDSQGYKGLHPYNRSNERAKSHCTHVAPTYMNSLCFCLNDSMDISEKLTAIAVKTLVDWSSRRKLQGLLAPSQRLSWLALGLVTPPTDPNSSRWIFSGGLTWPTWGFSQKRWVTQPHPDYLISFLMDLTLKLGSILKHQVLCQIPPWSHQQGGPP